MRVTYRAPARMQGLRLNGHTGKLDVCNPESLTERGWKSFFNYRIPWHHHGRWGWGRQAGKGAGVSAEASTLMEQVERS